MMRWTVRIVAGVLSVLVLAWVVLHWWIVPRADEMRPRLERWASAALAAPVSIGAVRAESNGLVPTLSLHEVQVHDPSGRAGLRLPRVLLSVSVLAPASYGLDQVVLDGPELELRRTADGRLLVGGIDLSGDAASDTRAADAFFSLPELLVRGGRVRWIDERRAAPPVALDAVQLVLRNGRRRHQIRLDATPPEGWGERFTLIGRFRQPVFSRHAGYWREWDGQAFADLPHVDLSRLRQYLDLQAEWGVELREGRGALRAWAELRQGVLTAATADLALGAVAARFGPKLEPLAFGAVSGRIGWRRQPGAMQLDTHALRFVDADGLAWPGGNFSLRLRDGAAGALAGGELRGDKLDLAALAKIAGRLPLPPKLHEQLQAQPVKGLVESITARWDGALEAPHDWRVQARLAGLSVGARPAPPRADGQPVEGIPGIEGAALELEAMPSGGHAQLSIEDGALEFPGVFEQPRIALAQLSAQARWRVQGEHIEVEVDELALRNADATGRFKARWQTAEARRPGEPRFPGVLDLQGSFSRANGARVHRYLPLAIPAEARHYVRDAVVQGEARDVAVRVKGNLLDLPFERDRKAGEFRFAGQVRGVTLVYVPKSIQPAGQPPWPALEELAGELVFEGNRMRVNGARGRVQGHPGWQFTRVQAGIDDLEHTRVRVEAEGRGPLATALGIVRASPLAGFTEHALDDASASGEAALALKLDLPIARIDDSKVSGRVTLQGNDVRLAPDALLLANAQGEVGFSETGFTIHDVRVNALGGSARVSGGSQAGASGAPTVRVRASGQASAEGLRQMPGWGPLPAIARQASGQAAYEAVIDFRGAQQELLVTSDLRGMAFDLPAPLGKPADAAWPLRYEARPQPAEAGAPAREWLRLTLTDRLALALEHSGGAAPARLLRGAIELGAPSADGPALPASGLRAQVQMARLDVSAWEAMAERLFAGEGGGASGAGWSAASGAGGAARDYLPSAWSLRVGELQLDERVLHEVVSNGTREGALWRAEVQARELAGRIQFSEGADGRAGKVHARLSRLSIPASAMDENAALLAEPPPHIPALDIVADEFELRGKKLGRLEIEAINRDVAPSRQGARGVQEWQLSRLTLQTPEASFNASGRWAVQPRAPVPPFDPRAPRAPDDARRTQLDFRLDIRDAGALLARFDMPGVLARGQGQLDGSIGWAGSPLSPHYPSMNGQLHLDMGAGQFLKADPGVAKLLGVLSLQSLPRRLTLDFRDVFSSGFAFDHVRGDVAVQRGVARTNNLQMKGVNAAVLMEGSADLDRETQDLRVLVVPEIDAGTAALAAAVINPAIGIGAFIAQLVLKQPLIKAATREFHIGGSWDNPQVRRIGAGAAAEPAGVPAAAPSPQAMENKP